MLDLMKWYFLISFIGLLAFPISYRLFPMLGDRGWGISRAFGLFIWGYLFWIFASLQIIQNNAGGALIGLSLVAILSVMLVKGHWGEIWAWLKDNKRVVIISEILFLFMFMFWGLMRSVSPDATGTEKPMELAFINSILRSPSFPPADPWLSGYSISYYYFGYVMVALLARLTGVGGAVAFNLASALWFSLTAISAYSIAYTLLHCQSKKKTEIRNPARWALLAPLFILIVSNLDGTLEMLHAKGLFWHSDMGGTQTSLFWNWLDIQELSEPPVAPYSFVPERSGGIWWWRASRVLQDYTADGTSKEIIDEFPFFSYYLADLHPHVLGMPFVLLTIAFTLNFFLRPNFQPQNGMNLIAAISFWLKGEKITFSQLRILGWLRRLDFWIAALFMGGLAFLNTWDFPFYVGLFCAVYIFLCYQTQGWSKDFIWTFLGLGISLGIAGIIVYLPFYLGFSSQAGGFLPSLVFYTRGVHLWVMFAPLLVPIIIWLVRYWQTSGDKKAVQVGLRFTLGIIGGLFLLAYAFGLMIYLLPLLGNFLVSFQVRPVLIKMGLAFISWGDAFAFTQGSSNFSQLFLSSLAGRLTNPGTWITLGVMLFFVWALLYNFKNQHQSEVDHKNADNDNSLINPSQTDAFVLLILLVGIGLVLAPEFLYMRDQFGWRMNTIFKFYFQAWILWGISAAYASYALWSAGKGVGLRIIRAICAIVALLGLAYPFWAIALRLQGADLKNLSLDSANYLTRYSSDEADAIDWLKTVPYGVIAEAIGGSYSGYARVSTYSGLPSVLGWPGHESQWRGGIEEMGTRETDIRTLYKTSKWEEAIAIIQKYKVKYIYFGTMEKSLYKENEFLMGPYLNQVFQNESVTIYEVKSEILNP